MAEEKKPAALPEKELGKEHRPAEPSDQAKGLNKGRLDSGSEAKVYHEDRVLSAAPTWERVTVVQEVSLKAKAPSLAEEGVSSLGLHVFAANKFFSSFLQCFLRLLHFLFFSFLIVTALVIMLDECVVGNLICVDAI